MAQFKEFMCQETWQFSPAYVKKNVLLKNDEELISLSKTQGVMVVFLHQGSWILAGGAIKHQRGLRYTVIASTRNLDYCTPEEKLFWLGVHERTKVFYQEPVFYSHDSVRLSLNWLKNPGNILGVALDVREANRTHKEEHFQFMDRKIYLQTGPAKLAKLANAAVIPSVTWYDLAQRQHVFQFLPAITRLEDPAAVTQAALTAIEPFIKRYPNQQFYDIAKILAQQHQPIA
jgi:lauroyl/myristoyl acyltransferase